MVWKEKRIDGKWDILFSYSENGKKNIFIKWIYIYFQFYKIGTNSREIIKHKKLYENKIKCEKLRWKEQKQQNVPTFFYELLVLRNPNSSSTMKQKRIEIEIIIMMNSWTININILFTQKQPYTTMYSNFMRALLLLPLRDKTLHFWIKNMRNE